MTVDQLRALLKAQPFQPFTVHLADGRHVFVHHPEYTVIAPSGRTAIIYQPNDEFNIVDLLLVTDLEVKPSVATQPNNP
ncbi:MAG: hypothetical protein K2R98_23925 [Gemmataceae bacterium]|nr:hypothetical protein [Gemmataceae bacterium]